MTTPPAQPARKPLTKRVWFWLVIVLAALIILPSIGAAISGQKPAASSASTAKPNATEETVDMAKTVVPDTVGMAGDDARTALTTAGFEVKFDAGGQTVIAASNWTVTAQSPAAGTEAAAGAEIVLTVTKPEVTSTPLTPQQIVERDAQQVCDEYSIAHTAGYSYNAHYLEGILANEWRDDGRFFLKYTATLKDKNKIKTDYNIECFVVERDGQAVVDEWNMY